MSFLTSRRLFSTLSLALVASLIGPLNVFAHGDKVGDIEIKHPYARPTLAGQVNGGVFFNGMFNKGKTSDYLVHKPSFTTYLRNKELLLSLGQNASFIFKVILSHARFTSTPFYLCSCAFIMPSGVLQT